VTSTSPIENGKPGFPVNAHLSLSARPSVFLAAHPWPFHDRPALTR